MIERFFKLSPVATLFFDNGQTEKADIVILGYNNENLLLFTKSGAYHYKEGTVRKYHPEFIRMEISMANKYEYDSSGCWIVDDNIKGVSLCWEEENI